MRVCLIPRTNLQNIPLFSGMNKNNMVLRILTSPGSCLRKRNVGITKHGRSRLPVLVKIGILTLAAFAGKVSNSPLAVWSFTELITLPRKPSQPPSPLSLASFKQNTPKNRFFFTKHFLDDQNIHGGESAIQNNKRVGNGQLSEKYHLIWSPKFLKKMMLGAVVWMFLLSKVVQSKYLPLNEMFHRLTCLENAGGYISTAVILPLLSSSCCAIQLMINIVSGLGCAGFNKYLGPIRPFMLSVLIFTTAKLFSQRSIVWTIVSLSLGFLPEVLHICNNYRVRVGNRTVSQHDGDQNNRIPTSDTQLIATLRLDVPTMGCVACVNKIDSTIRQLGLREKRNIRDGVSWLNDGSKKGGMAELKITGSSSDEIEKIKDQVIAAIENAGFRCDVNGLWLN
mmetsp:Transcript_19418/g.40569  ORF Transcript_19418/g.40569 Transcript_19418/m.40569 type:complete len:395 (+) Transcript_19418:313-1497(+)